uniref:Uncharacterized protein n=1 Tax=Rhizophora mucronata TaxID=61149 RepID=A0A2P2PGG7_RHIMU
MLLNNNFVIPKKLDIFLCNGKF